jgi:hypothetical protein
MQLTEYKRRGITHHYIQEIASAPERIFKKKKKKERKDATRQTSRRETTYGNVDNAK